MKEESSSKKILLSGIKPTGRPHIGNYFGAMKQFVELQDKYKSFIFVPDLHALISVQNKQELSRNIIDVVLDYLAIGLDPEKVIMYKQSDIPAHTELAWVFNCLATMPYLMRAHAFKDAEAKDKEVSVGLFDYPMLMAADILLYSPDVVPVGQDQKQHVEITRDMARKFNQIFGQTFKEPQELIFKDLGVVPGTDGQKMSKSYNNTIPLFSSDEDIEKAVMGIVTDSGTGIPTNVYAIHLIVYRELHGENTGLQKFYDENKGKYKVLKERLIKDLIKFIAPLRERRERWQKDEKKVIEILKEGGIKAKKIADAKMDDIREKIGVNIY